MTEFAESVGAVAVRLGYCKAADIQYALALQQEQREATGVAKPIGIVLLENGFIGADDLIHILKYYNRRRQASGQSAQRRS